MASVIRLTAVLASMELKAFVVSSSWDLAAIRLKATTSASWVMFLLFRAHRTTPIRELRTALSSTTGSAE